MITCYQLIELVQTIKIFSPEHCDCEGLRCFIIYLKHIYLLKFYGLKPVGMFGGSEPTEMKVVLLC